MRQDDTRWHDTIARSVERFLGQAYPHLPSRQFNYYTATRRKARYHLHHRREIQNTVETVIQEIPPIPQRIEPDINIVYPWLAGRVLSEGITPQLNEWIRLYRTERKIMGELTLLGKISITATPSGGSDIFKVDVSAENRDEPIHAETKEGETIDQFILRLKGMLKAMFNAPVKKELQVKEKERQKEEVLGGQFIMGGRK